MISEMSAARSQRDSCEDTEYWCKHEPSCERDEVKIQCPTLCGVCGKHNPMIIIIIIIIIILLHSTKTIAPR